MKLFKSLIINLKFKIVQKKKNKKPKKTIESKLQKVNYEVQDHRKRVKYENENYSLRNIESKTLNFLIFNIRN